MAENSPESEARAQLEATRAKDLRVCKLNSTQCIFRQQPLLYQAKLQMV